MQVAFLSASAAELATGAPVAAQLREAPILIALTFVAFSVASLVQSFTCVQVPCLPSHQQESMPVQCSTLHALSLAMGAVPD